MHRELKRILVTGATGTLGYNIVNHLASIHPRTRIMLLLRRPDQDLFAAYPNVAQQKADMANIGHFVEAALDFRPDAIVHCAASGVRPCKTDWFDILDLNVNATIQLFKASCEIDDCHFVHVSTGLVYDSHETACGESHPIHTLHPYGSSKAAADCLLMAGADRMKRRLTVVRPFSFTGLHDGGDRLFPSLLRSALRGESLPMSPGTQHRDFCAVQDVAEAVNFLLMREPMPDVGIFNVGSGSPVPLRETVWDVASQLDLDVEIRCGELPFHRHEPMHLVANTKHMRDLGWQPRTNLAYAVWQLAREQFPALRVTEPRQYL